MSTGDSEHSEHSLAEASIKNRPLPEIHSMMVASTAHITLEEAEALTENGYNRGVFGWFFYVGQRGDPVLEDLRHFERWLKRVDLRGSCPRMHIRAAGSRRECTRWDSNLRLVTARRGCGGDGDRRLPTGAHDSRHIEGERISPAGR